MPQKKRKDVGMRRTKSEGGSVYSENAPFRNADILTSPPRLGAVDLLSDISGTLIPSRSAATITPGQICSHRFMKDSMVKNAMAKYKNEYYYKSLLNVSNVVYKCSDVNPFITDQISIEILINGLATS